MPGRKETIINYKHVSCGMMDHTSEECDIYLWKKRAAVVDNHCYPWEERNPALTMDNEICGKILHASGCEMDIH